MNPEPQRPLSRQERGFLWLALFVGLMYWLSTSTPNVLSRLGMWVLLFAGFGAIGIMRGRQFTEAERSSWMLVILLGFVVYLLIRYYHPLVGA